MRWHDAVKVLLWTLLVPVAMFLLTTPGCYFSIRARVIPLFYICLGQELLKLNTTNSDIRSLLLCPLLIII